MSRISDVSSKLGQYMLAGWVLTDDACVVCSLPMLRSASGQYPERLFCIQCQVSPDAPSLAIPSREATHRELPVPSIASTSSTGFSGVSTPPTEVSSTLSSPTFAPPPDPQETLRRRAQSDLASAEIGRRMLQGWAMLAEECPNDSCYGVPLVRPPKSGEGHKDPRKECVVCGNVYVFEKDWHGLDRLVPADSAGTMTLRPVDAPSRPDRSSMPGVRIATLRSNSRSVIQRGPTTPSNIPESALHQTHEHRDASILPTLDTAVGSLTNALGVLTQRLTTLSGQEPLEHALIGDVALSMEKMANALRAVEKLRHPGTSVS